ncbi:Dyp-type peroxidase [Streptomyces sp. 1331.2]|uniref:Dyp-type peroxidase n=1 Tax=Streptomyces sp. 1331.2 TaxID=1938835 RepID=UPI000BDBA7CB|nr:Dyp-type peroxidase [Streptomyces sp. 1331.2]SOB85242.1 dye decolorizing peroxidase/deferrochelatase/peroxidase EfeB [Streptomyces sp. 1331.2]
MDRRALLAGGAVLAAGVGAGVGAGVAALARGGDGAPAAAPPPEPAVPFHGERQAGVTAPQQPATQLFAFDLAPAAISDGRTALRGLLAEVTRVLAEAAGGTSADQRLRGGEPARLTGLVGVGPGLAARLGLNVPAPVLTELPAFPGDRLDPARGGGDLLVQLCAADRWPLSVVAEQLAAAATAAGASMRWTQSGFLPRTAGGATPRNLFGFKDGTANPDEEAARQWVWGPPGPYEHGTVLVYRRIRMDTGAFAALPADRQGLAMGRRSGDGAPLTGTAEHDEPDIYAKNPDGSYVIPASAHVRLSSPRLDGGARMLRRGYSYDDGPGDRGLLFCAFVRDPAQFTRVQTRLAARDALNPFLEHTASAVAYVLPGAPEGRVLGEGLFG